MTTLLNRRSRAFGSIPRENRPFREYMAKMGTIERQLLNEALFGRGIEFEKTASGSTGDRLTITEASTLLPELQRRSVGAPEIWRGKASC